MGKKQTINSVDNFPDITNVVVPETVKRVMAQQSIKPDEWEADLNQRISQGGETKQKAITQAFGIFDKIQGSTSYSDILNQAAQATADRRAIVDERRMGREERATAKALSSVPEPVPTPGMEPPIVEVTPKGKATERVGIAEALIGSAWNSLLDIPEGFANQMLDLDRAATIMAAKMPWADELMKARATTIEDYYTKGKKFNDEFFAKGDMFVDEESKQSPIVFGQGLEVTLDKMQDPKKWAAGIGSGIGSLVSVFAPNKKVSAAMSFYQMYTENQDSAIEAGLTGHEALAFTTGTSTVGAMLEMLGETGIVNSLKGKAGKEAAKQLVKDNSANAIETLLQKGISKDIFEDVVGKTFRETIAEIGDNAKMQKLRKYASNIGKKAWDAGWPEAGTEFIQEWANYGAKRLFNGFVVEDEATEGNGRFRTDAWETLGNATFGAFLGGFLGGTIGQVAQNPKELHETMGAYVNADIKNQLSKNPNLTSFEVKENAQFQKVLDAAVANGQFNNPDGTLDQNKLSSIVEKSQLLYDTYYDFKDIPTFTAEDKTAMFNITDVRNQNLAVKNDLDQKIAQVDQVQSQIDQLRADPATSPFEITKLEAQKGLLQDAIGPINPETQQFEAVEQNIAETERMESVFAQAMPHISSKDLVRKGMGRSFLNSNITAFRDPNFQADSQVSLPDGTLVVHDDNSTAIRRVDTIPVQPDSNMSDQLATGEYKPITRFEKQYNPIDNFDSYNAASQQIQANQQVRANDQAKSPYSFAQDAEELTAILTDQAATLQINPDVYPQVKAQVAKGYDLYNQIVAQDSNSSNPVLNPLTEEEFNAAIGFELQETPSQAQEEVSFVDPQEEIILAKQKQLGLPSTVEDVYTTSPSTLDTILDVEQGTRTTIDKIESALRELVSTRKTWQKRRDATRREFTIPQINDVISSIEYDMQNLANEKAYIEDPDLRPAPSILEANETNENSSDENADSSGDSSTSGESRSIKPEYAAAAAIEGPLELATEQAEELQSDLGLAQRDVETALETGEDGDIARAIEAIGRVLDTAEQSDGQAEELLGKIDELANEITGDGNISEEPDATNESASVEGEQPTIVKKKGIPKDKRQILNKDRLRALAKFPNNIQDEVDQFFIKNGQISTAAVQQLVPGSANEERQNLVASTRKDGYSIDGLAHALWEESNFPGKYETSDYKDVIEDTIRSFPGIAELTRRVNAVPEQNVDTTQEPDTTPEPDVEPDVEPENLVPVDNTFQENLARSEEDPDFVPFSQENNNAPVAENQTMDVLSRLAAAFPNITLNIAPDVQTYTETLNNVTSPQMIFTPDNAPYGYINPADGSINLDPSRLNVNTAIHEYGHIWGAWAKQNNPQLYQKGLDLVKESAYFRNLLSNPSYNKLNREQMLDEALSTAIGNKGESLLLSTRKSAFRSWMDDLFKGIKDFFGFKQSPANIADMTLDEFTSQVVKDITSGKQVSSLTSQQAADIISNRNVENLEVENPLLVQGTDPIMSATPTVFGAPGSNEIQGTSQQLQDMARSILDASKIIGKTTQSFTDADKKLIKTTKERYGWEYRGRENVTDPADPTKKIKQDKWKRDIKEEKNSFVLADNSWVMIPRAGLNGKPGRVAQAIYGTQQWLNNLEQTGGPAYKTAKWLLDSTFDRLNNLETFVQGIDTADGLFKTVIRNVKRQSSNNRNDALNIMDREYEEFRRSLGKYSTHKGSSTLDTVEKIPVTIIQWDRSLGKGVEKIVHLPVGVVMNIVASHQSQLSMGDSYNLRTVKDAAGEERFENHTSSVIDDQFDVDPNDASLFYKTDKDGLSDVHKGVHFKKEVMMEMVGGELKPVQEGRNYGLFRQSEIDRLENYVMNSGPEAVRTGFRQIKQTFNNTKIRQKLQTENDEVLNPGEPFKVIPDYSPIQTVNSISAQDKVNSFAPNLEDSKQLNERTARPDSIYAEDIIDSFDYYKESVSHILGSAKLVHNLKNLQQAIQSDYEGPLKERLDKILKDTIENLQNYRQSQWKISHVERILNPLVTLMGKYTAFIFRSNLGISAKQIGTWFSAYGLGYIENKYLFGNKEIWYEMLKMSAAGSTIDRVAGGSIIENTGQGLKVAGDLDTREAKHLRWLLGEHITDPVELDAHRMQWATVIQRVVYGQSQYTEAADMGKLRFTSAGLKSAKQLYNKIDSGFEEYGMANIRRLDRAVILGYMIAAKAQVADEVKSGKTSAADANARTAEITTETLYLTNQMSDPSDLTRMQRNQSFGTRVISVFSGQTQKLWNQMAGSTLEYYKQKETATPEQKEILKNRMVGSLVSNILINTSYMAITNMVVSMGRAWLKGDDDKEDKYYLKKFGWDFARYATSLAPGLFTEAIGVLISKYDNEKWEDELFDIPGTDILKNGTDLISDITGMVERGLTGKSDKDWETLVTGAIYNFSRVFGVVTGAPKTWTDPMARWINNGIKPKAGLKKKDIELEDEFVEDSFVEDDLIEDDIIDE